MRRFYIYVLSFAVQTQAMCESIPAASIPPGKRRAFVARWVSGVGHLAVNSVPSPGHLQTAKNLIRNIVSQFPTTLRLKSLKHHHFGIRRAFIDHKRIIKSIKPFALSLFNRSDSFSDLFYEVLLNWNSCVYQKMATNVFVYWSDGLGGRVFDHHSWNRGRGIWKQQLLAGPGIWPIFSKVRGLPGVCSGGGGCSRLELTRTF